MTDREKYWNEDYVAYWQARVREANVQGAEGSQLVSGDAKTTPDDAYLNSIALLGIGSADSVVEVGCGFGRSLPRLSQAAGQVAAVDISAAMIKAAQEQFAAPNITFHVSESEHLPFADDSYDVVVCFAAFDAMYQAQALVEMARISKVGGRMLITGKNDNYHDDDEAALAAEIGARRKGHPNYFTDVARLVSHLDQLGLQLETQRFFPRRGDFSAGIGTDQRPARFYEYLMVLRKTGPSRVADDFSISAEASKTFARREAAGR